MDFRRVIVSSMGPYSCWLLRIWRAYQIVGCFLCNGRALCSVVLGSSWSDPYTIFCMSCMWVCRLHFCRRVRRCVLLRWCVWTGVRLWWCTCRPLLRWYVGIIWWFSWSEQGVGLGGFGWEDGFGGVGVLGQELYRSILCLSRVRRIWGYCC